MCVVGGGVIGSWAAVAARKRGQSVVLVEQFQRCHSMGSSHGDGRIWRKAYEEDVYVDMMEQSLEAWTSLSKGASEPLLAHTGMLCLEDDDETSKESALEGLVSLFERRKVSHERMTAREVRCQFSQYDRLPDDIRAVHLDDAGVVYASKAVASTWALAENLGVHTMEAQPLRKLSKKSDFHIIDTKDHSLEAKHLIVAPGSWLSQVASTFFGVEVPTRVTRELVSYHGVRSEDYSVKAGMPVFTARCDNGLGPHGYYGIPKIDVQGLKVSAHHCGELIIDDNDYSKENSPEDILASNKNFLRRIWGSKEGGVDPDDVVESQRCLYTGSPDLDYILGPISTEERVILVGGGSGHAFKNAPALGEAAACLALGITPPFDVSPFAVDRPAIVNARGNKLVPTAAKCK